MSACGWTACPPPSAISASTQRDSPTDQSRSRIRATPEQAQCCTLAKAGGMAEWSMAVVLKTTEPETVPGVRIPLPPPDIVVLLGNLAQLEFHPSFGPLSIAGLRSRSFRGN